jgi:hypothetical protein
LLFGKRGKGFFASPIMNDAAHHFAPLRILFITLEFRAGAFSGNGVYAQSQVRALAAAGHTLHVLSGRPDDTSSCGEEGAAAVDVDANSGDGDGGRVRVTALPLPRGSWGRLDARSGWREFAKAARSNPELTAAVAAFKPDVVLGVDWSSLPAWQALQNTILQTPPPSNKLQPPLPPLLPPFVYSNFRVFTRTDAAHAALESSAVSAAAAVITLCPADAEYVTERLSPAGAAVAPAVVLPPLRDDVRRLAVATTTAATATTAAPQSGDEDIARVSPPPPPPTTTTTHPAVKKPWHRPAPASSFSADGSHHRHRVFVTCCVRLSPEKEPERFIELVEELARRGVLEDDKVVPLLCASTQGEYAEVRLYKLNPAGCCFRWRKAWRARGGHLVSTLEPYT